MFIQATAWLIQCDMLIVDTSCTLENPSIHISGNIEDENLGCKELIYLGSKSNCHYQSLQEKEEPIIKPISNEKVTENVVEVPQENMSQNTGKSKKNESREQTSNEVKMNDPISSSSPEPTANITGNECVPFIYDSKGILIEFKCVSDNYTMKCPGCSLETRYIIQHLMKGKCQTNIDIDTFKSQLQKYKDKDKEKKLKELRQNKQMRRKILREQNEEKVKEQRRTEEAERRQKLRAIDEEKVKEHSRIEKASQRKKARAIDEEKVKEQRRNEEAVRRQKLRALDEGIVKQQA